MTMIASTSRTWMNPPMVYEDTSPRAHRINRITAIVSSMARYSGVRLAANRDPLTVCALTALICAVSYKGARQLCSLPNRTSPRFAAQSAAASLPIWTSGSRPPGALVALLQGEGSLDSSDLARCCAQPQPRAFYWEPLTRGPCPPRPCVGQRTDGHFKLRHAFRGTRPSLPRSTSVRIKS